MLKVENNQNYLSYQICTESLKIDGPPAQAHIT